MIIRCDICGRSREEVGDRKKLKEELKKYENPDGSVDGGTLMDLAWKYGLVMESIKVCHKHWFKICRDCKNYLMKCWRKDKITDLEKGEIKPFRL